MACSASHAVFHSRNCSLFLPLPPPPPRTRGVSKQDAAVGTAWRGGGRQGVAAPLGAHHIMECGLRASWLVAFGSAPWSSRYLHTCRAHSGGRGGRRRELRALWQRTAAAAEEEEEEGADLRHVVARSHVQRRVAVWPKEREFREQQDNRGQ